jgi:DNA-directed RNA polymerase specialized sigma24 family protein
MFVTTINQNYLMPHLIYPGADLIEVDIEKLRTGDLQSFQELYNLLFEEMQDEAMLLLIEKEKAATIVQHSFIKAWLHSADISSLNYVTALLASNIRNNCLSCNTGKGRILEHYEQVLRVVLAGCCRKGFTSAELFNQLKGMPPAQLSQCRNVFAKYYWRRLSVNEIAGEISLPAGYVQEKLDLAFQMLHVIFNKLF